MSFLSTLALFVLFLSYLFSFSADMAWYFELFTHFLMQYAIIGLVLAIIFLLMRRSFFCIFALCIALGSFTQARLALDEPVMFSDPLSTASIIEEFPIKFLQFNQNVENSDLSELRYIIGQGSGAYDIVVIQEANADTVAFAQSLKPQYPYQIHLPKTDAFGVVVMSRYPIVKDDKYRLSGGVFDNMLVRFRVSIKEAGNFVDVYAVHVPPPMNKDLAIQRNQELLLVANKVAQDGAENAVMIGDFNISPYSPYFKNVIKASGLHYQATGIFQNSSWPTQSVFPAFQIPIDHILFSPEMRFLSKGTIESIYSDHNIVVSTLGIKRKND